MSASNPFAAPGRRAIRPSPRPTGRNGRRAPDHPPVVRRIRRMGLTMPLDVQGEIYRRWQAMTNEERLDSMDAEAELTDDELRSGWAELLEDIAEAKAAGGRIEDVRSDG